MASVYQELEAALVAKFLADAWFFVQADVPADPAQDPAQDPAPGSPHNARTALAGMPDTAAPAVDFTDYFRDVDLPAVLVLTLLENPSVREETFGEVRYEIPVKVLCVLSASRKAAARDAAQDMAGEVERVLLGCRTSSGAPSITGARGCFLRPPSSTADVKRNEGNRRWYATVETDAVAVVVK